MKFGICSVYQSLLIPKLYHREWLHVPIVNDKYLKMDENPVLGNN